jgi:hypothetical protein
MNFGEIMKHSAYLLVVLAMLLPAWLAAVLPTCYYTYDQIYTLLEGYHNANPDIARVVLIGFSELENIPIYAMRISDNVDDDEDEPALLFVGQVHAEEVLGVQITMNNISEILAHRYEPQYTDWINQLDMWFVPTVNPEGHNVVTSNMDISYRKNKHDNNNNGMFDYLESTGYDIDGVDINRNFSFNWVHGDTLMQPGGLEVYDYYRGPSPMSESENQAIKNLCDQKKFIYSICWHSSRTGNFSEKVYYPFNWKEIRPSPDLSMAASIAQGVGAQIIKQDGTGSYEVYPNLSRKGAYHDWMYQQYGTIAMLIECGTRDIQPDSLIMVNTVQRCRNGVYWLLNRALFFSTAVPTSSMLTGKVLKAGTSDPLEAEIIIQQHNAPWFEPRRTNSTFGRFWRPLATGTYTVIARKKGYTDVIMNNVNVPGFTWSPTLNITMTPKPEATLAGMVRNGNQAVSARIIIGDVFPDTLTVNGDFVYQGFVGEYPIQVYAEGYYPWLGTVNLSEGNNYVEYNLSPITTHFSEDWENGTSNWEIEGPWVRQTELSTSGYALTDSWGGNGFYDMNCNVWIKTASPIYLPAAENVMLSFDSHLITEWDFDQARVEVSLNGSDWESVWTKSGNWDSWRKELVPLSSHAGQHVYLRFRLSDQSTDDELTDPGWTLDNIRIFSGMASENDDPESPAIYSALYPNYPNPFNPETTISFSLSHAEKASLKIFNLKGQLIKTLVNGELSKGEHKIVWKGTDDNGDQVGSGIYLYRLDTPGYTKSYKMVLMK